jgi:hypothetical protein
MRRILVLTCALALVAATNAAAQEVITGTVARVEPGASVIVLSDGRMYQTSPDSVIIVNEQPTTLVTLEPGTQVVLRSATPVTYRDGQYVVVTESPVASEESVVMGEVIRAFTPDRTVFFSDGRKVEVRPDSTLLINNEPARWGDLTPGTHVIIQRPGRISTTAPSASYGRGPSDENYDVTGSPIQAP